MRIGQGELRHPPAFLFESGLRSQVHHGAGEGPGDAPDGLDLGDDEPAEPVDVRGLANTVVDEPVKSSRYEVGMRPRHKRYGLGRWRTQ